MSKASILAKTVRVYLALFSAIAMFSVGIALPGWPQDDKTNAVISYTTTGDNVTVGEDAGNGLAMGDSDVANDGHLGESKTIKIGTRGTRAVFIAGISTSHMTSGTPVVVTSSGQLGILKSSVRDKLDIRAMGEASSGLMSLRPVTFRYEGDPIDTQQYGLIADEVEKVYPQLVTHGTDGKSETVAYHLLPVMLLNEVQKQSGELEQEVAQIAVLERQLWQSDAQIAALHERLRQRDSQMVAIRQQLDSSNQEVDAVKEKVAQVDALVRQLDALERWTDIGQNTLDR